MPNHSLYLSVKWNPGLFDYLLIDNNNNINDNNNCNDPSGQKCSKTSDGYGGESWFVGEEWDLYFLTPEIIYKYFYIRVYMYKYTFFCPQNARSVPI